MDATVKKIKHSDRITLSPHVLEKLCKWGAQLNSKNPGVSATRSDLVAWLIETHSGELSSSELAVLQEKFFDSVKYAKWAVKAVIEAKARGEVLSLKLIGKDNKGAVPPNTCKANNKRERKSQLPTEQKHQEKDGSAWPDGK